jgi:hypothetical protein
MTRRMLKMLEGQRMRFSGRFERFGTKTGWQGRAETTVLLKDVKNEDGKQVCDHLWFNLTKGFRSLGDLRTGDVVGFDARVTSYVKGYVNHRELIDGREIDYKLSYPTRFRRAEGSNSASNILDGDAEVDGAPEPWDLNP